VDFGARVNFSFSPARVHNLTSQRNFDMFNSMFFTRHKMTLAYGAAVALTLRTLVACGVHFTGHCDSNDCNAPQGDGWRAAHETHALVCLCGQDPAAAQAKTPVVKNSPPPFFVARCAVLPQPQIKAWRARMEKPPPGLVLKKMSQMLC